LLAVLGDADHLVAQVHDVVYVVLADLRRESRGC
jgi:hypothetical protein